MRAKLIKFWISLCGIAMGMPTPPPALAQQPPLVALPYLDIAQIDLVPKANNIFDRVKQKNYESPAVIYQHLSYFKSTPMAFQPIVNGRTNGITLSPPQRWRESGFTVVAGLALQGQPAVGTVFELLGSESQLLFAVMRDSNGRFWIGKRRDAAPGTPESDFLWYAQKVWDPYSPCARHTCESDTLYMHFWTNGQIQMDEIVKYVGSEDLKTIHTYGWETGLLNFGLPQSGYHSATGIKNPIELPEFWDIQYIRLGQLAGSQFRSPSILGEKTYSAMPLTRFAIFSNQRGKPGFGFMSKQQMLEDQNHYESGITASNTWTTCSTGLFEQPAGDPPKVSEQYDPSQLPAPCTVPSAPTNIAANLEGNDLWIGWEAPGFAGTAFPNQNATITGYQVDVIQDGKDVRSCAPTEPRCRVPSIDRFAPFDISVAALRNSNRSVSTTTFPSAAQRVHFGVPTAIDYLREEPAALRQSNEAGGYSLQPMVTPHLFPSQVMKAMTNTPNFTFVIAHLGAHSEPGCPESSACAIQEAFNAGADGVQFDIRVTADGEAMLGHDDAVARELNNWNSGSEQTRDPNLPFANFPQRSETYANLARAPFLTAFDNRNATNIVVVDPKNPTRTTMFAKDIRESMLVDSYNQGSPLFHQLSLYQALWLMGKLYNMMIWIKVDNVNELLAAGRAITLARARLGATGALNTIGFKINWSTLAHPLVAGNPGQAIQQGNIVYLLQVGTGDFDAIARSGGDHPSNQVQAQHNILLALTSPQSSTRCQTAGGDSRNGCVGVEVADKYSGAPTNWFVSAYRNNASGMQTAIQQPVPPYAWLPTTLPVNAASAYTSGNVYPRPDGTCCSSLNNLLTSSYYFGAESQDNRALPGWVEQNRYSTITTDSPLPVLRDLYKADRRSKAIAAQIGGANVQDQSGGKDDLVLEEGLYRLTVLDGKPGLLIASGSGGSASPAFVDNQTDTRAMWYIMPRKDGLYTITNARVGQSLTWQAPNKNTQPPVLERCCSAKFIWKISRGPELGGFTIATSDGKQFLSYAADNKPALTKNKWIWLTERIAAPAGTNEITRHLGPPGYIFCASKDQNCNVPDVSSIVYGAHGHFLHFFVRTIFDANCTSDLNLGTDPNCSYAPFVENPSLDKAFEQAGSNGERLTGNGQSVAYGAVRKVVGNRDIGFFTYKQFPNGVRFECSAKSFDFDPAPSVAASEKACSMIKTPAQIQEGPPGFTFCAGPGGQCVFSATAAIAYGSNGNFTYKVFANGIACNSQSFDVDPNPGVDKSCFYKAATPAGDLGSNYLPASFQPCESETKCSDAPLGSLIAYGQPANRGLFAYATKTEAFDCDLDFFGWDPDPNIHKSCYWSPQSWVNRAPAGFTFCAREGEVCHFNGVAQMAFGADGKYVFLPNEYTQTMCTVDRFGKDPYPEMKEKACFYRQP